jgi:hypothetical protein
MIKNYRSILFLLQLSIISFSAFGITDKKTFCELDRFGKIIYGEQTAIIFDLTDRYSDSQIQNIQEAIIKYANKLKTADRLILFGFDKFSGFQTSLYKDNFCLVGNPNWLTASRNTKSQKKIEERRIIDFFNINNPEKGTSGSPIIDAIISASRSQFITTQSSDLNFILVSDLVEYSDFFKLTNNRIQYNSIESLITKVDDSYKFPMKNAHVTVLYVQRENYREIQSGSSLELLWTKLFKKFGAVGEINFIKVN